MKLLVPIILAVCFVGTAFADKVDEAKQSAAETVEAADKKREEFVAKMKRNLSNLEQDIAELKGDAASASGEARDSLMKQLGRLEAKRDDLKTDLDKATKASGAAWKQMQSGLENAWKEVRSAYKKASDEFKDAKNDAKEKINK